jgi:hypothetical protein
MEWNWRSRSDIRCAWASIAFTGSKGPRANIGKSCGLPRGRRCRLLDVAGDTSTRTRPRQRGRSASARIPLSTIHASGHATTQDLQRLASAIGADRIVSIHTAVPESPGVNCFGPILIKPE